MSDVLVLPWLTHARIGYLLSAGRRVEALALLRIEHEDNLDMAMTRLDWRWDEVARRIGERVAPPVFSGWAKYLEKL